jgi:hypothetical protein
MFVDGLPATGYPIEGVGSCMESHVTGLSKKQEAKLRQEIKQFKLDKKSKQSYDIFGEEWT